MRNIKVVNRNIVFLFKPKVNDKFIKWSRKINQVVPSKIVLNNQNMLPHVTLYGSSFPVENETRLQEILSKLTSKISPFQIELSSKSIIAGTIFINVGLTSKLYHLHENIVDALNYLRERRFNKKELESPGLTEGMKSSLIRYGMLLAKKEYIPHVTVARPYDHRKFQKALNILPEKIDISCQVSSINLVETGPNGTCKKIIKSFPLTLNISGLIP